MDKKVKGRFAVHLYDQYLLAVCKGLNKLKIYERENNL